MEKLTGKGKHKEKVGKQPDTNMISKRAIMRRVQTQDTGDAFEVKRAIQ